MNARYEVRWSNGFWKAFDTHHYTSAFAYFTKKDAEKAVATLNSPKKGK